VRDQRFVKTGRGVCQINRTGLPAFSSWRLTRSRTHRVRFSTGARKQDVTLAFQSATPGFAGSG